MHLCVGWLHSSFGNNQGVIWGKKGKKGCGPIRETCTGPFIGFEFLESPLTEWNVGKPWNYGRKHFIVQLSRPIFLLKREKGEHWMDNHLTKKIVILWKWGVLLDSLFCETRNKGRCSWRRGAGDLKRSKTFRCSCLKQEKKILKFYLKNKQTLFKHGYTQNKHQT